MQRSNLKPVAVASFTALYYGIGYLFGRVLALQMEDRSVLLQI